MPRLFLFMTLLLIVACTDQTTPYPNQNMPPEISADTTVHGKAEQLFLSLCASCHGRQAEGRSARADFFQPPAPDFTAAFYREADPAYLFWRIAEGKTVEPFRSQGSVMPAWRAHFSDEQIWQLVAYIQSRPR